MRIESNNSVYFNAKLISKPKIGKIINNTKQYSQYPVSFVKIEAGNKHDIRTLENVSKYWRNNKFAANIYYAAVDMKKNNDISVYALTSQYSDFETLNDDNILGLVQTSSFPQNATMIERIQVLPDLVYDLMPEYKGVGSAMISSLKELCHKIVCFPSSEKSVKDFYLRNGFAEHPEGSNCFTWYK